MYARRLPGHRRSARRKALYKSQGRRYCVNRALPVVLPFIKQLVICSKRHRDLRRAPKSGDIAAAKKDVDVGDGVVEGRGSEKCASGGLHLASEGRRSGKPPIPSKRAGGAADIGGNRRDRYSGKIFPTDHLLALMAKEVRKYAMELKTDRRCLLCPFRSFSRPCRVREHLAIYHAADNSWCASGLKQLRTCKALYDHDKKTARPGSVFAHSANYLRRSADIIRSDISL